MSKDLNVFYTYAYLREDKTPYYIGKGKNDRAFRRNKNNIRPPKDISRVIFLKQNLSEEEAFRHEIYMIFVFGRKDLGTGILRNRTNGGEGTSGFVHSQETKKKQSESKKGKPSYWKGKKLPQEIIDKQIETKKRNGTARGENNPRAKKWRITFEDGRVEIVYSLQTWAVNNGYNSSSVRNLYNGSCTKKHKDIVKIEQYDKNGEIIIISEEENAEKLRVKNKKDREKYQKNIEKQREYQNEWQRKNRHRYYKKNKEKILERQKKRREEDPEKYREYSREHRKKYREKNREQINEYQRKRYREKRKKSN